MITETVHWANAPSTVLIEAAKPTKYNVFGFLHNIGGPDFSSLSTIGQTLAPIIAIVLAAAFVIGVGAMAYNFLHMSLATRNLNKWGLARSGAGRGGQVLVAVILFIPAMLIAIPLVQKFAHS